MATRLGVGSELDDGLARDSTVADRVLGAADPRRQEIAHKAARWIRQTAEERSRNDPSTLWPDHEEPEEGNGKTCVFQLPL